MSTLRINGAEVVGCLTQGKVKIGDIITSVWEATRPSPVRSARDFQRIKLGISHFQFGWPRQLQIIRNSTIMQLHLTKEEFATIVTENCLLPPSAQDGALRVMGTPSSADPPGPVSVDLPYPISVYEKTQECYPVESRVYKELLEDAPIWEDSTKDFCLDGVDDSKVTEARKHVQGQLKKADEWIEKQRPISGPYENDAVLVWALFGWVIFVFVIIYACSLTI